MMSLLVLFFLLSLGVGCGETNAVAPLGQGGAFAGAGNGGGFGGASAASGGSGGVNAATGGAAGGLGGANGGAAGGLGGGTCETYKSAVARPGGLLEACDLVSASATCPPTLASYLTTQLRGDATTAVKLVEGCGTRSVGWDASLGGYVLTYDANNQLIGYAIWNDVPHGPCATVSDQGFLYTAGTARRSLFTADASCASDVVCTVPAPVNEATLHCPSR
jgi:hypothetical protein